MSTAYGNFLTAVSFRTPVASNGRMSPREEPIVNPWLIAVSVMLATFMEVIDTSIASVALPHIAGSLSATTDEATWVLTSYLVANAIVLPASGWFSLRFGRKRFLLTCIVIFTISSFMCGAATSLAAILIARAVQGAGGGALQPLAQSILLESFPPEKRGAAMAMYGLGVVVAPVLGPTLGGWLTDQYSWRWAFYINIPIGALAIFMISRFVNDPPYIKNAKPGRIDGIGLGLLAVWLGALQMILDKGQEDDWFGAIWIRWATVILLGAFFAFIVRELKAEKPLVNLQIFRDRNFAIGTVLIGLFGGVIYGVVTLLPLFYQTLLGYTAQAAGWAVSPRGVGAICIMPIIGVLTGRIDNRWLIVGGFAIFGATSLWMANLTLEISPLSLLWPIILSGVGSGMVFVPLSTISVGTLRNEQIGNASGLFNLMRNVGGGIGISLVNTLVARHSQVHRAELAQNLAPQNPAFRQAFQSSERLMSQFVSPNVAAQRAYGLIQGTLDAQSAAFAYVDVFRFLAMACFGCAVVVFGMKRVRSRKGAASVAH
jgi:DHA2 family multidrug resistance protein